MSPGVSHTSEVEIWHNPRCSKSRQTLALLQERAIEPRVRLYLEDPPSSAELESVLESLGMEPWELARTKEPLAKEVGLPAVGQARERWVELMAANSKLIERPVVIASGRAIVGRPPERVLELF